MVLIICVLLQVTVLFDRHTCVSTMRVKTKTPSQKWVASKAVDILRDHPKIGAKELQDKLQSEHHIGQLEKKYYEIVQEGLLEGKEY